MRGSTQLSRLISISLIVYLKILYIFTSYKKWIYIKNFTLAGLGNVYKNTALLAYLR